MRDIHALTVAFPQDVTLERWAAEAHAWYEEAKAFQHPDARQRCRQAAEDECRLLDHDLPFRGPAGEQDAAKEQVSAEPVQAKLYRQIVCYSADRFAFVAEPAVPPDTSAAARGVRHLVTSRTISGASSGERCQDSSGITIRHLAVPGYQSILRLPATPHIPSRLNSFSPAGCRSIEFSSAAENHRKQGYAGELAMC